MSRGNRPPLKDMYWFAHGGAENEKGLSQRNSALGDGDDEIHGSGSPTCNIERRGSPDEQRALFGLKELSHTVTDGSSSSGPSSLERDDRLRTSDKRLAVEEKRKQLWEAEQERNDAMLRKHMEREAALEARRNAQRSHIAFAFGSSVPRNVETLHANEGSDADIMSRSFTTSGSSQREENHNTFHERRSVSPLNHCDHTLMVDGKSHRSYLSQSCTSYSERKGLSPPSWLMGSGALIGDDVMSKSMNASLSSAPRGRRKNDLMPTVPYERTPTPRAATSSSTRKRSVSMTRLDQLAQPRKHYLEANKASSSASSGASSLHKDNIRSPTRPLSSASENSGGSGRVLSSVTRRVRSSPRKPRPISIAGTMPDQKQINGVKPFEVKLSPTKRSYTPNKLATAAQSIVKTSTPKPVEKLKSTPRPSATKLSTPKPTTPKSATPKSAKQIEFKQNAPKQSSTPKNSTPKAKEKKSQPLKKKTDSVTASPVTNEVKNKPDDVEKQSESQPPVLDSDVVAENDKNNSKRIISEEEARAALAEKRRLAREQAEREAELERQKQEELRLEEEERLRKEEEDHRKMEEEQIHLLEEHRRQEDEKLRKAIEDQEQKEEEERVKRDEEIRMKAEQEKKAKEEAEKQRIELEEKLRKEEEERAERKKRLEKIMSRTRGKSSGTSPSGSVSGSDQLDSGENPHEGFSSGANSLESNETEELPSEQVSVDDHLTKAEISSVGDSLEANPTYEIGSENESLNSNDLMMPASETASPDNSLVILPDKELSVEVSTNVNPIPSAQGPKVDSVLNAFISESQDIPLSESSSNSQVPVAEITENADFDLLGNKETWSPENDMKSTSVVEEPTFTPEVDHHSGYVQSEVVPQENEMFQSQFEREQALVDDQDVTATLAVTESFEAVASAESPSPINSELPDEVENQQDLAEIDKFQIPLHEDTVDAFGVISNTSGILQPEHNSELLIEPPSNEVPTDFTFNIDAADPDQERQAGFSMSSDIKLPDPIYETSDDGSVSSEKLHQVFGVHEEFYTKNQENTAVLDEVFSQQAVLPDPESIPQDTNPFAMNAFTDNQNSFSDEYSCQRSEVSSNQVENYIMNGSIYENELVNTFEQPEEIDEENVVPSRSSTSSVIDTGLHIGELELSTQDQEMFYQVNKENIKSEIIPNTPASQFTNEFSNEETMVMSAYDMYSDKENMFSPQSELGNSISVYGSEKNRLDLGHIGDNPFVGKQFPADSDVHTFQSERGDFNIIQQDSFPASEQVDILESQTIDDTNFSSKADQIDDVTFIKADDSGACIGIISSIDHDQVSNDFSKPSLHNEQLKNNFEFASMTDSEDNSSLDSNLSQVMTVENTEKDTVGGLNHVENSESNSTKMVYSNGEQHNPFDSEHIYNNDSLSKSSVNNFSASEVISNGHGLESSKPAAEQIGELHGYMQLGGNDILSVDHSKNNIFDNVDAIDYSKVSSDPFLAKGNSNQISGNPFLLQDDQKQVLMTQDFLN